MSFAGFTLAQLVPILAIGSAAITGLYLLRMRRREVVVPFAALWEQVTRESESRQLWRRLRRLLSWLLQMLVLVGICAALGDPRPDVWLRAPSTLALVIDRSASMAAVDRDGVSRIEAARARAAAEIAALGPADRAVVIAAGEEVGVAAPLGGDTTALLDALPRIEPSWGEADLGRALALAAHTLAEGDEGRILVLTDGALDDAGIDALTRCADGPRTCQVVQLGAQADNLAITAFAARRYPNARDKIEVLAEVRNLGQAPAVVELDIEADGVSVGRRRIELAAGAARRESLADLDAARSRFVARLHAPDDAPAGFSTDLGPAFDDTAWAVVPPLSPLRVVLVSDGTDLFLDAALLTQGDHVELVAITPAQAAAGDASLRDADVVFFDVADGPLPSSLPEAHVVLFDPWRNPSSPCPIARGDELRRPFLTEQLRDHPILANVVLKDVNISRGTSLVLEPSDQALVRSLGAPIMVLRERGEHGLVAIGFDPRQSDLPLRVAFPLLVDNLLHYFEQREPGFVASFGVGTGRELALGELGLAVADGERVVVVSPGGSERTQPVDEGRIRLRALEPGIYTVRAQGDDGPISAELAVNQGSIVASDLQPRIDDVVARASAGDPPTPAPVAQGPLWTAILLLVAGIVVVEWATYHRRITV